MTTSEKQSWELERTKGYDRFLLRSLLKAGLPFGIFVITLTGVLMPVFSHDPIPPVPKLLAEFGVYVLAFGAPMGAVTWRRNEQDYNKPAEDADVA